ncbi:class I SAM-dependent DNA methyltransferase [Nonomuraea pusilla]|uniref:Methyltransferase domain-containing protein n=1 Tax=Nonomuraea pusilla TaxID=46177 RepID=A0A1H7VFU0_9ACTN|nr:class I SAM-dependent methyltransferase [Nonomuraea pusilla]SEM07739.1 Methyltransferase domain-containing protein [Nonomuraea pusilla]
MTDASHLLSTRASYNALAEEYDRHFARELDGKPLDRGLLGAFAEIVRASDPGPVADLGCGTGIVTAHLDSLGVRAFGVDLSPGMLAVARRNHPELRFEEGSLEALDLPDNHLAAAVCWYSVVHTPPERQPLVFAELARVLRPGGHLLIAFQVGDEPRHFSEVFGHQIALDFHRLRPDRAADQLAQVGLLVTARLVRDPDSTERTSQGFLLARKATP